MLELNMCPFFRKCSFSFGLEKGCLTSFMEHYCFGKLVSNKHIAIHKDNPCITFKNYKGEKIEAYVFFKDCSLAAYRSAHSENLYKTACLGLGIKSKMNLSCSQYKKFTAKTLMKIPALRKASTK